MQMTLWRHVPNKSESGSYLNIIRGPAFTDCWFRPTMWLSVSVIIIGLGACQAEQAVS